MHLHHAMQDDFGPRIEQLIDRYCASGDQNMDKVERIQSVLNEVQVGCGVRVCLSAAIAALV